MYVCICNAITDNEIRQAVELGACSFRQISDQLGVATCCGKCRQEACQVIKEHKVALASLSAMVKMRSQPQFDGATAAAA